MTTSKNSTSKTIGTFVPLSALGDFSAALEFLNWLTTTKQNAWQLLPLHQTHLEPNSNTRRVPSPYQSYGIGLDPQYISKIKVKNLTNFSAIHSAWINDYALFCALTDHFKTDHWPSWPKLIRSKDPQAILNYRQKLATAVNYHLNLQIKLHSQFAFFHQQAKKHHIKLIGDLPFYLPLQSPLVWINQNLFDFDHLSGLPDSPKAHFGRQVWGHPLYKWTATATPKLLALFRLRICYLATLYDSIRLDHLKGLYHYGSMSLNNPDQDRMLTGPGTPVLKKIITYSRSLGLNVFAEDSGDKLNNLRKTLAKLKVPGVKILRFALITNNQKQKLHPQYADINNYPKNSVAYTTTHDTETLLGYLNKLTPKQRQLLASSAQTTYNPDPKTLAKNLRQKLIDSPAQTIIIPIQDWLLTTDRINIPGTEKPIADPNWRFHLPPSFTPNL